MVIPVLEAIQAWPTCVQRCATELAPNGRRSRLLDRATNRQIRLDVRGRVRSSSALDAAPRMRKTSISRPRRRLLLSLNTVGSSYVIHRSAWKGNSQKFAPGFGKWHHALRG